MESFATETHSVAWRPSGRGLAVGSVGAVWLWSRAGVRQLKNTGSSPMYGLAFSADESRLACGSESKTTKVVDLRGKTLARLAGDSGAVTHLSFDSTGRLVAGRALWSAEGKPLARKRFAMASVFVKDGLVAGAGPDHDEDLQRPVLQLTTVDGVTLAKSPLPTPLCHVTTDGAHLALSAGPDVLIFDLAGREVARFNRHKAGHKVSGLSLRGGRVASGGYGDTSIRVSALDGSAPTQLPGYARPTQHHGLAFAVHRPALLAALGGKPGAGGGGDRVTVFDLEAGTRVELIASAGGWLAVDERGGFMGSRALAPAATQEDPELLARIFVGEAS